MSSHKRTRISSEGEKRVHQLLRTPNEEKELSGSPLTTVATASLLAWHACTENISQLVLLELDNYSS